jgi:hypothetical protein
MPGRTYLARAAEISPYLDHRSSVDCCCKGALAGGHPAVALESTGSLESAAVSVADAQPNSQNSQQLVERQDGDDTNNPQNAWGTVITGSGRARETGNPSADCDTSKHLAASLLRGRQGLRYILNCGWSTAGPVVALARIRPVRRGSPRALDHAADLTAGGFCPGSA